MGSCRPFMSGNGKTAMEGYVSYLKLVSRIGLRRGDIVNVSSDVLKLICVCRENNEEFDPNLLIDTILEEVGPEGTVLFPTYNWGFCRGETFDYCRTLSETGGLSNAALKRKDFKRTKHPIYSFAVWGRDKDYLCRLDNSSSFGQDSPFGYLDDNNAKNLFIGIDYKYAFAFVHYLEEIVGVSYRHFKDFTSLYIDEDGVEKNSTYRMYVRDLSRNVITEISPSMDDALSEKGYYSKRFINDISFGLVDLHGAGDIMKQDIAAQGGLVYPKPLNPANLTP